MSIPTTEEIFAAYAVSVADDNYTPVTEPLVAVGKLFRAWQREEERKLREKIYDEIGAAIPPMTGTVADNVSSAMELSIKEAVRQGMFIAQRIVRSRSAHLASD